MKKPTIHSSRVLLQGDFYKINEDWLGRPDGEKSPYVSLQLHHAAAVILAQDEMGRYILNREYRHPTGEHLLGCPGGRLEPGEDPLIGGLRELLEETGYTTDQIQFMGSSYPFPGICNQKIHFLWARNCKKMAPQNLDPLEYIVTELKEEADLYREIHSKSQIDGLLCTALWYKDQFS